MTVRWNAVPMEIGRELFQSAVSVTDPRPKAELKEHIARFLHSHKGNKALGHRMKSRYLQRPNRTSGDKPQRKS